ncbi:energy-coupling factor ABC transporter permease [Jeongeupia naejangsanensis]|uniref:Energy-coupling factor ABC transporter permease n=1 Tax=Jeongeupia naejangsanensis TaxID=613195 RepID=A0ABS2BIK2_9NEIS|nr:energy-coupling factor ABC transporter permease [Jeongeupia naejangsanensis]MBM3115440.1 energy-coupling factor ABC transporter permease [Jeongeupia naejangsanensis]
MNLVSSQFPLWLLALSWFAATLLLIRAALRVPWFALSQSALTGWLGATVVALLFWQMKANIQPGLSFHLIGATALTLIAGRDRALLGLAAALAIDTGFGHAEWGAFGLSWLIIAALPCLLTQALLRQAQTRLPLNYFIYIFLNAFGAAALSMWLVGLLTCSLLAIFGPYALDFLLEEQLPYYFLMGWPEAFTTGTNLALLVIYRPQWVATFDDAKYLAD